ncbi:transcription factor DYT1-like [Mangifera indica]|uniref:transcription factor DYT1-like n=1 Tax=Mangifera indica TaxID=29780 RepID=UPI001CFA72ED|nr:transcription factor DYT1-like [Mangifera indica]
MEYQYLDCGFEGLSITEDGNVSGTVSRTVKRKSNYDYTSGHECKSKNLQAERRRRQKLSDRLLTLRALAPRITNMKKETIIEDAINYIQELQGNVKFLSDQLHLLEMEPFSEAPGGSPKKEETDDVEETNKHMIQEEVEVGYMGGNKVQIKIIFKKKRGKFTKLLEALSSFGFQLSDTSITSAKGAILVSSFAEAKGLIYDDRVAVEEARELLLKIVRSI